MLLSLQNSLILQPIGAWSSRGTFPGNSHPWELFVAKDRDTALRTCLPYLERKYQTYVSWGQSGALPQEDTLDLPFDELRDQRFISGSPDDGVEQLRLYHQRLGANHFLLRVQWAGMPQKQVLEAITLVGERIIPHLRDCLASRLDTRSSHDGSLARIARHRGK